ncbi:MAG: type II CAAX endopeptidase family protein [Saprospiraceae bacterium]|nr:type II CAAX endopeptidase family protein [Saprospiraceae bacterium]
MRSIWRSLFQFFGLACLISWGVWLPLYLPAFGYHGLPVLPLHHALGGLGPMIAAFWMSVREKKQRALFTSLYKWRPLFYVLIALISPFLLNVAASVLVYFRIGQIPDLTVWGTSREFPHWTGITFFLYNLLFFGFGEETGWRGYVLPRLQGKFEALPASLILAGFWALWHLPLFFYRPGYVDMNMAGITGWILSLATGSVLLSWLLNSSGGSLLVCAIFHATVDIAFTSRFSAPDMVAYTGMLITIWGVFTIIRFKPRNLSSGNRVIALSSEEHI